MTLRAAKGTKKRQILEEAHRAGPIVVPVGTVYGASEGPTLCVIGGIHGTEYSGIEAAVRLFASCDPESIAGTLVVIPVANMPGFLQRTPSLCPVDDKDINRVFPGSPGGSYSEVVAHLLLEKFIRTADYLLSLHGGHAFQMMEPCIILGDSATGDTDETRLSLAKAYDVPYIVETVDGRQQANVEMLLPGIVSKAGITAMQTDAGGQGVADETSVQIHVRGLMNVLKHVGMVEGRPEISKEPIVLSTLVRLRANQEGLFYPQVRQGEKVTRQQRLGIIADFFGQTLEEIWSPVEGVVLAVTTSPAIRQDGIVFGIGTNEVS